MASWSNGSSSGSQPGDAGSTPVEATHRHRPKEDTRALRIVNVSPFAPWYQQLVALLESEPLRTQWHTDAESVHEPGTSYMVALVDDVPAAWAGWRIEADGVLRCCNNYVRHGYRGRTPELYAAAYKARHRDVVLRLGVPAETFLYPEPMPLHEADGWVRDGSPDGSGQSRPFQDGPIHHWQRLTWSPS